MTKIILFVTALLISTNFSCQSKHEINEVDKTLTQAEQNIANIDSADLKKLEIKINELQQDLEKNREKYTDEEVKEIGKLQGRYVAFILKKQVKELKDNLDNFKNQMEGFIEGINNNSNNQQN